MGAGGMDFALATDARPPSSLSATLPSHEDWPLRDGPSQARPGCIPLGCQPRVLSPRTDCLRMQLGGRTVIALFVPHSRSHHGSRAATGVIPAGCPSAYIQLCLQFVVHCFSNCCWSKDL